MSRVVDEICSRVGALALAAFMLVGCDLEKVPPSYIERDAVKGVFADACAGRVDCEAHVAAQFDGCFDASGYPSAARALSGDYQPEVQRGVRYIMQCIRDDAGEPLHYEFPAEEAGDATG